MVHSAYDAYHMASGQLIHDFTRQRGFPTPNEPDILQIIAQHGITLRIQTCTVMLITALYRDLVDSDPYLHRSTHFLMGDTQIWAEVSTRAKIGYLEESLATYRMLDESGSRTLSRSRACRFQLSDFEMKMYLCDKYGLPESVRRDLELRWCRTSLQRGFFDRDGEIVEHARRRKGSLTMKEWLWYLGARHGLLNRLLMAVVFWRARVVRAKIN